MVKQLLSVTLLSFALVVFVGFSAVDASEITGTLSSGGVSTTGTTNVVLGSISGSVSGGSVIAGNIGGGSISGNVIGGTVSGGVSGGSSTGNNSGGSTGQVLGASTDVPSGSYPGLPITGRAE